MSIDQKLKQRNADLCELCNTEKSVHEYTVTSKSNETIDHQVATYDTCLAAIDSKEAGFQPSFSYLQI